MRDLAIRLALPLVLLGSGCATAVTGVGITPGQPIRIAPPGMVTLPDRSTLRYIGIENDSRCPPKVFCVHAGSADIVFEHRPTNGDPRRLTVNSATPGTVSLGAWTLSVLELVPGRSPPVEIRVDRSP
ncbi:hypothetical protein [Lysobacter humi (ex Lee et al. 2017)]